MVALPGILAANAGGIGPESLL
uniref:Uncharacterized protein n=1 Tax=Rhizophora mucronata TaxID=61149 RepID=A0A2P2PBV0_RHIMU